MAHARSARAINQWKKRESVIYSTDRKNEANKMFIIWLLPVLGDRKQVQDARFDGHLTGVRKESFHWRTKTIAHNKSEKKQIRHVKKVYSVKTKSTVSFSSLM